MQAARAVGSAIAEHSTASLVACASACTVSLCAQAGEAETIIPNDKAKVETDEKLGPNSLLKKAPMARR